MINTEKRKIEYINLDEHNVRHAKQAKRLTDREANGSDSRSKESGKYCEKKGCSAYRLETPTFAKSNGKMSSNENVKTVADICSKRVE